MLSHVLASELADDFVAGSVPHPSMQLEGALFQRDVNALFAAIKKPLILLNAKVRALVVLFDKLVYCLCYGFSKAYLIFDAAVFNHKITS